MQFVLLVCRKLGLLSSFRESFSRLEIIAVSKKYNELEKVRKSTLLGSTYPPRKGLLPANQGLAWNLQTQKCRWGSFSSCFLALGAFQVLPGWGVDYLDPPNPSPERRPCHHVNLNSAMMLSYAFTMRSAWLILRFSKIFRL